jgi:hypothetical protein
MCQVPGGQPSNTALEATGHSVGFCAVRVSVGVARASAWAFGRPRRPAERTPRLGALVGRLRRPNSRLERPGRRRSNRQRPAAQPRGPLDRSMGTE